MSKSFSFLLMFYLAVIAYAIPSPPPRLSSSANSSGIVFWEGVSTLAGTQSAQWHPAEGYLELPLKFQQPGLWRLAWDLPFVADLTYEYGVEFDFYVSDLESVNQSTLHVYLHSGAGWYRMSFGLRRAGCWNHVVLNKSQAAIEDQPAGWGQVAGLRISIGCFDDPGGATAAIANLRPCQRNGEVLVIPAGFCMAEEPEVTSYKYFAERTTQSLDELGVVYMMVPDLEVSSKTLKDVKVAILPYNPKVPEGLVKLLEEFVANGGKLLTSYNIPEDLARLLGVKITGWKRCEDGRFQGLMATSDALPRQPALACQEAPHTNTARLVGEGRVFANWANPDGTDSGLPAALETPTGIYLARTWIGPDGRDVLPFYRAMLAELAPGMFRQSAEDALGGIGFLMDYNGLDDIQAKFPATASTGATAALARAFDLREQAQKCLAEQEWLECRELCEQAQSNAVEALCRLATPGPASEQRAFWCHSAFGLPDMSWDESIKFLADNGFNAILVNSLWAGVAFYPSEVLPPYSGLAEQGDQLRKCLDACKKYGVKCHVWMVAWNLGYLRNPEFTKRMNDENRTQVSFSGKSEATWLCPSNPQNRQLMADAMLELVRNYPDIAGLHFDYIRYPGRDHCFCDGCRRRFEERIGHPVENWPADTRGELLADEWGQFRRDQISALVKLVHDEAKALRPELEISAAVLRDCPQFREIAGQDWEAWCREGWLDFVCPMDYTDSLATFRGFIQRQLEWAHGVRLCPGIGLSVWKNVDRTTTMLEQLEATREFNLPGFTVFNFDQYAQAVLPLLRLGGD